MIKTLHAQAKCENHGPIYTGEKMKDALAAILGILPESRLSSH